MVEEIKGQMEADFKAKHSRQPSGVSLTDSVVARAKKEPARKDADHEFFNMTLLAQVLSHKHQKQLIELNLDAEVLLKEVKKQGIPFFNWNNWIAEHIESSLYRFQAMKRNRISVLCRQGYNKLMNNIGKD